MNSRIITSSSFHIPTSPEESNSSSYSDSSYIVESEKRVFTLEWSNLTCIVHGENRDTVLLNSVSGYANPGELTALMGPSGCGKTTLLNKLAKRDRKNRNIEYSGKVMLNSIDINKIDYFKYVGYVTQEDILLETLTPKEALLFVAQLKLSNDMKYNYQRAQVLIESLHLYKVQNTLIGSPAQKKLSGGERRRVSIGIELISNPGILFLDEPTSGLDVQTADAIIELLRSEARNGKTILSIIHQPSYRSYKKFDKLILMSEGNIIYHDKPSQANNYFNHLGGRVPRHINPADHFMSLLHIRDRLHKTEYETNMLYSAIELYKGNEDAVRSQRFKELKPDFIEERVYKPSITIEMKACLARAFKNSYRNDAIFKGKIIQNLLECILLSIIFQDLSTDATGVQNRNGFLFFIIIPQLFETNQDTLMSSNLYSVPMERDLFYKEKAANMYSLVSYLLPKLITELPFLILLSIIYSTVIYWFINLNPHFLNFTIFSKV